MNVKHVLYPAQIGLQQLRFRMIALGFAATILASPAAAQQFDQGEALNAIVGEPVALSLSGLTPGATVDVVAERLLDFPRDSRQASHATFVADERGRVDITGSAPISGTFEGVDPSGLFWSMRPNHPFVYGREENVFRFTAYIDARPVARTRVTLDRTNVELEERAVPGFPGAFLLRPTTGRDVPTIIVLGGAEGDDFSARALAPRFAQLGYAVLGLPYYSPRSSWRPQGQFPELPGVFEELPIDRLDTAFQWLRRQPGIDGERVGLWGISRGAEFALIAATQFRWIKAVAAIVPTDVITAGWGGTTEGQRAPFTYRGRPYAFVPAPALPAALRRLDAGLPSMSLRDAYEAGRRAHPEAVSRARIPIDRYDGRVLVAGGAQDDIWSSARSAQTIAEARASAGKATELLVFENAGHMLSGTGWEPPITSGGGSPTHNAAAQRTLWEATARFFRDGLQAQP